MSRPIAKHSDEDDLRGRAETVARTIPGTDHEPSSEADAASLLHELRVHQIELEIQNDELRRAQADLEVSRGRYLDLYELAPVGYLSLNENGLIVEANLTIASLLGVERRSLINRPLSAFVVTEDGDLFHKFLHRRMEEGDAGSYSCELRIKSKNGEPLWVQLEATRAQDGQGDAVIRVAVSDISRRMVDAAELLNEAEALRETQEQLQAGLKQRERDLETIGRTLSSVIDVVVQVVESRDPYTAGHQRRVAELATAIALDMGKPTLEVEQIRVAALMHDVGKITIPAEILSKPGRLSDIEFELIKLHSEAGFHIVDSARLDGQIAQIIYQHHERCDGSGYPRGLSGTELLPESKVLMVADVVEAMVSHRPYRAGLGVEAALEEIKRGSGRLYDSRVAESCARVFTNHDFKFSAVGVR